MLNGKRADQNLVGGIMHKLFKLYYIVLLGIAIQGCSGMSEDVGCVPVHIGTGYDDEGMMEAIYTTEVGCPRLEDR